MTVMALNWKPTTWLIFKNAGTQLENKQAGAELGQAQLKLELELSFTDLRFLALSWLTKILMATLTAASKYPAEHK